MNIGMKLTGWYDGDQKPVRKGVYEVYTEYGNLFRSWNGKEWGLNDARYGWCWCYQQDFKWRGLTK